MSTIYSAAGTFPLKIRESISTRFSGLIEYSATYLIEKGTLASSFAVGTTLGTPLGIVSIFPGVRYLRSNDSAFDEMEVTAYGQGFVLGTRVVYGTEVLEISKTLQATITTTPPPPDPPVTTEYIWTVYETWRCETATKHSVIANNSSNYSDPFTSLDKTMIRRWHEGDRPNNGRTSLNINWDVKRRDVTRTNFGAWDEVGVMIGYVPEVS